MSATVGFVLIAGLLTLATVVALAWPLLRHRPAGAAPAGAEANAAVYRDQLQALERDLANGNLAAEEYETARDEIRARLLVDVAGGVDDGGGVGTTGTATTAGTTGAGAAAGAAAGVAGRRGARAVAAVLMLVVPLAAAGLYWRLGGGRAALDPASVAADGMADINRMVEGLAARLRAKPDDPKGWAMLARSYKVMGRFDDAEEAIKHAGTLRETDPDLMVAYADLLALRQGKRIEGEALRLVERALKVDAHHPTALLMSGVAAERRGDYRLALQQFETLGKMVEPGSPDAQDIDGRIADVRRKLGLAPAPLAGAAVPGASASATGGTPSNAVPPVDPANAKGVDGAQINQMVERLAARLKQQPDDLAGWARLARAYKVQKRFDEAAAAYERAGKLVETDPDLLTQYADLLATRSNSLSGKPAQLVAKALALDPRHAVALMLAAQESYQREAYRDAIGYWERALPVVDPKGADAAQIRAEIAQAKQKLAGR